MTTSVDTLASIDPGNGFTNGVVAKGKGYKAIAFPSVRAAATGDSLGLGGDLELQYQTYDWNGHRYIVGDDVTRITKRSLERHMGAARYGDEFHQMLTAVALAELGVKKGTVHLTMFAPPGMYLDVKQAIIERYLEQDGMTDIHIGGEKKTRRWQVVGVDVYPEGIGAAACFVLADGGTPIDTDALSGDTLVLDVGAYTLDALRMVDGSFNPEALESATWENAGLQQGIRQPVLRNIKKQADDFANVTVDDIDAVMRTGLSVGDWTLRAAGLAVDIQPIVDKFAERYAETIANNVIDGAFDSLRGIRALIVVGGGTQLVEPHLRKWYGDKLLDRTQYAHTKKIHPVDFNCVGGLRLTQYKQMQST